MSERLDVPEIVWRRVSTKLIFSELVGNVVFWAVPFAISVFLQMQGVGWAVWVMWAAVVCFVVSTLFTTRRVRAYGYQLRDDDLLFRRGIMFLRVVAVPYGRMQLVDINRGPLSRALGLSELKFVTAAASTGVTIPGLRAAEAEELRDQLVVLAESRRAGL